MPDEKNIVNTPNKSKNIGLLSAVMMALDQRQIKIHEYANHGNLFMSYSFLHRRTARAISSAINAIELEESRRQKEGLDQPTSGNPVVALDAFLDAVYRVAELFEFYDEDIPKYFALNRKPSETYKAQMNKIKRPWTLLCNRCKHNHAFLIPVEGMYKGDGWLTGFSLYERQGDFFKVNKNFHKGSDASSYNWALRALLGDLLRADYVASNVICQLSDCDTVSKLTTFGIYLPYASHIENVLSRSPLSMPGGEDDLASRSFNMENGQVNLDGIVKIMRAARDFRMTVLFDLPGTDINISGTSPYGVVDLNTLGLHQENNSQRLPIMGQFRFHLEADVLFEA